MPKDKLPPIVETWRKNAKSSYRRDRQNQFGRGEIRGISFQFPTGWDDGSGKVRHVQSGPFKGRVCWTSKHEATEVAKRHEGMGGGETHYDA